MFGLVYDLVDLVTVCRFAGLCLGILVLSALFGGFV